MVFYKLNLPQQKPNYKIEVVIVSFFSRYIILAQTHFRVIVVEDIYCLSISLRILINLSLENVL